MARFRITAPDGSQYEITAPDTASDAEVQSVIASQFTQQTAPIEPMAMQIPAELSVSQAMEQPLPQIPTAPTGNQLLKEQSQRFNQALISGMASLPLGILQAQEAFQQQIPAVRAAQQAGIEVPSLRQELAQRLPEPVAGAVTFEPKNLAETGVQIGGGLLALEEPILEAAPKAFSKKAMDIVEESSKAIPQVQAKNAAELALIKNNAPLPSPATPSETVLSNVADIEKRYAQKPIEFNQLDPEETKLALGLDKKLSNLNAKRLSIQQQLQTPDLTPELKTKLDKDLLAVDAKYNKAVAEGQQVIESRPFKLLLDEKQKIGDKTISIDGKETKAYNKIITKQGVHIPGDVINYVQTLKPVGKLESGPFSTVDHRRLIEQIDGKLRGDAYRLFFEPFENAAIQRENFVLTRKNIFNDTVNKLGINNLSEKEMKTLYRVADGKITSVEANLPDNQRQFLNFLATEYKDLLDRINASRVKVDLEPIKARQNYITHFRELSLYEKFGFGLDVPVSPTELNKYKVTKEPKFGFGKQRKGEETVENVIKAYEAYLEPASKQIFYTEPASIGHDIAKLIPDPNFKQAQKRFINEAFLGELDFKDQALYEAGLAPVLQAAEATSAIVSRGVILANAKVISSQASQILATVTKTGLWPTIVGLKKAAEKIPKELSDASSFLTLRKINDDLVPIEKGILQKPAKFATALLEFADKYVAKASWHAGFVQAQRNGWALEPSIRYADDIARMLHANYNAIYKAPLLRGKSGRALFPLQTFAFNAWNHLVRDPRVLAELKNTSRLRETMKILGAMVATNQVYDQLGIPAPFEISLPENLTPEELVASAKEFALGNIPLVKSLQYGTPAPALSLLTKETQFGKESILKNSYLAVFSDDEEKREEAAKQLKKLGAPYVPGGLQTYKTLEGLKAADEGFIQYGNDIVLLDERDKKLAPIFGVYQTPSVRKARRERELQKIRESLGRE